jgi:hypothetical protein
MASRAKSLYKQVIGEYAGISDICWQIMWAGNSYPAGKDVVRRRAKEQFLQMRNETDPQKIDQAIAKGGKIPIRRKKTHNVQSTF